MKFALLIVLVFTTFFLKAEETNVESNTAHYDGMQVTLLGNVSVENSMGRMTAQKAILHRDEEKTTKIDFPWVELSTDVALTLSSGGVLECQNVYIDYTKMTCFLFGSLPVTFKNEEKEVCADKAQIDYEEQDGTIKPIKITLKEHVRLINHGSKEHPTLQYALADSVVYFPDKQLMVLEGKDSRVLFYDQVRGVELSAKAVHAQRDKETKKETIQGIGDVHCVFGPDELEKLKKQFHWEQKP